MTVVLFKKSTSVFKIAKQSIQHSGQTESFPSGTQRQRQKGLSALRKPPRPGLGGWEGAVTSWPCRQAAALRLHPLVLLLECSCCVLVLVDSPACISSFGGWLGGWLGLGRVGLGWGFWVGVGWAELGRLVGCVD